MTSNNSFINEKQQMPNQAAVAQMAGKRRSFLQHNSRTYWWLSVICAVVYCFAGPIVTLLYLDNVRRPSQANYLASGTEELLYQRQLGQVAKWFCGEGFIFLYLSAVVLAAIIGCVMFLYLQQKRQVNFYHSQPIRRTRLFLNQYVTGLLVNVLPLLLMVLLSCLTVMGYGLGAALSVTAVLQHIVYMLLLVLASYSIAVLASQLAGTMLTQMALNAVLHFAVPVAAAVLTAMHSIFFATYSNSSPLLFSALNFSPLCAAVRYLGTISYQATMVMQVTPMAGSTIAVQILLTAGCSALAWFLYQKRPSEATGKALVYPVTEPLLKAYLMFVISLVAGFVFLSVGNKLFFYFAVLVFAVLTHMTCEVIIQHDFKAMVRRMPQCAVIVVLILAVVGVFRFDLMGYESYLPAPEKVEKVALLVRGIEDGYGEDLSEAYTQDATVKQLVYDLLQPVVTEKQFDGSYFASYRSPYSENVESTTVYVKYVLTNGKVVERHYNSVSREAIEDAYMKLYNQAAYRDARYRYILQVLPEWVTELHVDDVPVFARTGWDTEVTTERAGLTAKKTVETVEKDISDTEEFTKAKRILKAYQQDLHDRSFETLTQVQQHHISIRVPTKNAKRNYSRYVELSVFTGDQRTMAVLDDLNIDSSETYTEYEQAYIFSCKDAIKLQQFYGEQQDLVYADGREFNMDNYQNLFGDKATLVATIAGAEQVNQFIRQTRLKTYGSLFTAYDDTHFVLLQGNHPDVESEKLWEFRRVYANTLPQQYQ